MTDKTTPEELDLPDGSSIMTTAFEAFTEEVPDWHLLPVTALLIFIEDQVFESREWAFKTHSPKHAQEWSERVAQYQKSFPNIKEQLGVTEAPTVSDELGKVMLLVLGASTSLVALALELVEDEDGAVCFDDVWTDEFIQSDNYRQMAAWGDQSFTWLVLKMQELLAIARPVVLAYEKEECAGVDVSNHVMPLLVLANSILFILMLDHMDEDIKQQLASTLESLDLNGMMQQVEDSDKGDPN